MTCAKMKSWISCEGKDFSKIGNLEQFYQATEQTCSNLKVFSNIASMAIKSSTRQPNGRPCEKSITKDEIKFITSCQIEKLEKQVNLRIVTEDGRSTQEVNSWIKIIFPLD